MNRERERTYLFTNKIAIIDLFDITKFALAKARGRFTECILRAEARIRLISITGIEPFENASLVVVAE